MALSPYEAKEWDKLLQRKEDSLTEKARHLVPAPVRKRAKRVAEAGGERVKNLPGSAQVGEAYTAAAGSASKALTRTVNTSLSADRVVKAYTKRGVDVAELDDLLAIDLKVIDKTARFSRLRHSYAGTAFVEGGMAGLMMTGGVTGAAAGGVFGLGVGAAPGLGAIAATLAGDAAAVLGLSGRVVAHTAMYYGFDPTSHEEELFLMSVISLGMATGQGAKVAAFADLHQLTGLLIRRAPWAQLNDAVFTQIMQKFAAKFSERLTQRKLGQFVPFAGVAVGAALNYKTIDDIAEAADLAYRERWLRAKGAVEPADWSARREAQVSADVVDAEVVDEVELRPLDIAREELGGELGEDLGGAPGR